MKLESVHHTLRKLAFFLVVAAASALPPQTFAGVVQVVEFYNAGLGHYFISPDPAEIAVLDSGAFGGAWTRTGESFPAWDLNGAPADTVPVCRFFGTDRYRADGTRIGANSHFYAAIPADCEYVKTGWPSVANNGISYPAWTLENYSFAAKLPVGGACPAGTLPIFRTYNNGMHGDPNHRYSLRTDLLQGMTAWTFEGLQMCVPGQVPTATAVGVSTADATTETIGPAGGNVSAEDGRLTLTIPAGALASDTVIGIQRITNFAHGGIGAAYRLTPNGQTFMQPITLTFTYADVDLLGTSAKFLGAAFQTADRYWKWLGAATVDVTARTVSVNSSHFTDISEVKGLQIRPGQKTLKPGASVELHVKACYQSATSDVTDELSNLGLDCDNDQGPDGILTVDQWSVNGVPGGDGIHGTVAANNTTATYTAPANAPSPPTVAVSGVVHVAKLSDAFKELVVSNITIASDSWTGTATGIGEFVTNVAEVTWTLDSMVANVAVYKPFGTASSTIATIPPCSFSFDPSIHTLDPDAAPPYHTEGTLTVDFNATPPTYHGYGLSVWRATLNSSCGSSVPNAGGGPWFGGSGNTSGIEAVGVVSADGATIQGSGSDTLSPPTQYTWKFTRQQ